MRKTGSQIFDSRFVFPVIRPACFTGFAWLFFIPFLQQLDPPTAQFDPVAPVCPGLAVQLTIQFTGQAPWSFDLEGDGTYLGSYSSTANTLAITVNPSGTTTYAIQNLQDAQGFGAGGSVVVTVLEAPAAALKLNGPDTLCAGLPDSLVLDFSNVPGPYQFVYALNDVQQAPVTTNADPYVFATPPLAAGTTIVRLDSVFANGCYGPVSGLDTITVLPVPKASIPTDTVFLCYGLTDTLRVKLTGPKPVTFWYTLNGDTLPPVTTSDTLYKIPIKPDTNFVVYKLLSISGGSCNGTVSGTYGVMVGPASSAVLSGDTTVCGGNPVPLTVDFQGAPPYIIEYTANGVPQPPDTAAFDPRVLLVTPDVPTQYLLTKVYAAGCPSAVSGQAIVNVLPKVSATISGGGQVCQNGTGTNIIITFQGPGPYTYVYSSQTGSQTPVLYPPITTTKTADTIHVNPPLGTFYRLESVTNGPCEGFVSGVAVVAVFTPSTAFLNGDLTFCNAADTVLMVDFTGSGPFQLVYSINGIAQPLVETFDDPYFIPVNVTATTTYDLVSVESPGCIGSVIGDAVVTVNYPPAFANVNLKCNQAAGTYTVEFDVLNGTPPYTLISGSGTFSGNHFTSNNLPIAQAYAFVFRDKNDCGNITVSGSASCNCQTKAGTMDLAAISACTNTAASATHHGDQTLGANAILRFVLHTSPALPLGQILAWNTVPVFTFGGSIVPNTTYYISAIAGTPDGMGQVDLNDPCLSVSQGTPVIFFEIPSAALDSIAPLCPGNTAVIPVSLSGAPPFALQYSVNGVLQPSVTNIAGTSYNLSVPVNGPSNIVIESVSDLHCVSGPTDTLAIGTIPSPEITNPLVSCDFFTNTYTLEFDVTGQPPFLVSGVTGFFTGNHFTGFPAPSSQPYAVQVTDAGNCGQDTLNGVPNCVCGTDAGTMDPIALIACAGDPITALHYGDASLNPDDTLVFVLHGGAGAMLSGMLATNSQPVFQFIPGTLAPGTTYYVSAVAGSGKGTGNIDLGDPCLSVSPGTPVSWRPTPSAAVDANFDVCPGQKVYIPVTFSGTAPFTLTYTNNGVPNTVTTAQSTFTISATLLQTATFLPTAVSDAHCPGVANGQAVVTVHQAPQIANVEVNCTPDNYSYTVEFDVLNADLNTATVGGSVTGILDKTSGHFVSNPITPPSGYSAIVSDSWMCGVDSINGGANCSCVTSAGSMNTTPQLLCFEDVAVTDTAKGFSLYPGDTLVYALTTTSSPLSWSVLQTNTVPVFSFDPAQMSPGVPYYIVALAGNKSGNSVDPNDPCFSYSPGPAVTWKPAVTATLGFDTGICLGDSALMAVYFTGIQPFNFVYSADGVNQPALSVNTTSLGFRVWPTSTTYYAPVSVSAGGCPGTVSGGGKVVVHPLPEILSPITTCDLATETYTLQFSIGNGAEPNGPYFFSGVTGAINDTIFTSNPIPSGQVYTIKVLTLDGCADTISGTAVCQCTTDAGMIPLGAALSVCLPDTAFFPAAKNTLLDAGDTLQYILYQNAGSLPQGVLAKSPTPQFTFQPGMSTGQTYYIAVMAGDRLPNGSVDTNDPCLSLSPAIAVVFHDRPTGSMSGDTTICIGGSAKFKIKFTGKAPFLFEYALNGVLQASVSAPQNSFTVSSNNILQKQVFTLVSVQDAYCTGTVGGSFTIDTLSGPSGSIVQDQTICAGDSATLTLHLGNANIYDVVINGDPAPISLNGVQNGATFVVHPTATTAYFIGTLSAPDNHCPGKIGGGATVALDPPLTVGATLSDFGGGYQISCAGETDGAITLSPSGGTPPFAAIWDMGAGGLSLQNLSAGSYAVTVTDQIGCTNMATYTLSAPAALALSYQLDQPNCTGQRSGGIAIQSISGGVGPYSLTINGQPRPADAFPSVLKNLPAGDYQITVSDINGCETSTSATLADPPLFTIDLGPDTTIHLGDSVLLGLLAANPAIDSLRWTPLTWIMDSKALPTWVKPQITMNYQLWVRDTAGCVAEDQIQVVVNRLNRVYIPNVIQLGAAHNNNALTVYGGPEVRRIRSFRVYDRWGSCLFEGLDLAPNDPAQGWAGRYKGQDVSPGVYVYVVDLEYADGTTEVRGGDVTVVR